MFKRIYPKSQEAIGVNEESVKEVTMVGLKDMNMEEKKESVSVIMGLLKTTLIDTGLVIAFDKTNNKFLFLDRKLYATEKKCTGFEIAFDELTY